MAHPLDYQPQPPRRKSTKFWIIGVGTVGILSGFLVWHARTVKTPTYTWVLDSTGTPTQFVDDPTTMLSSSTLPAPDTDSGKMVDEVIRHSPSVQAYAKRNGGDYAVLPESNDSEFTLVEIGENYPDHFELGFEMKIARDGRAWVRGTSGDRSDDWHADSQPSEAAR